MWGMAARIMQAMGLHRDGGRWNLDEREVEQRRMVFWELYTTDIFNVSVLSPHPVHTSPDQS
jgi:hypothetical protein